MTENKTVKKQDVIAAVERLLARVPKEPPAVEAAARWRESQKKTDPDSPY